jgi:hypothetical protein
MIRVAKVDPLADARVSRSEELVEQSGPGVAQVFLLELDE